MVTILKPGTLKNYFTTEKSLKEVDLNLYKNDAFFPAALNHPISRSSWSYINFFTQLKYLKGAYLKGGSIKAGVLNTALRLLKARKLSLP